MGEQNHFASFVDQLNDSWGDTFDTGPIGDLAAYNRYVEVHAYQHAFVLDISVVKRRKRSHARLSRRRHQQYQSWQSYSITSLATSYEPAMASKWLELLKGVAPQVARVAIIYNPQTAPYASFF